MKIYLNDPFKRNPESHRSLESLTEREKWDSLSTSKRVQYIWDYYKLPIVIACVILYAIGYMVYRHVTHKDVVLYAALTNVNIGETLEEQLTNGFLEKQEIDASKNMLSLSSGWYLTDDPASAYHEYTYATRMKVLASISSEQLDVVLMNQEAFDAFAQNGYLCNIDETLQDADPALHEKLSPYFVENVEIIEDNAEDLIYDSTEEYVAETTEYPMGIDLNEAGMIKDAGFEDAVYFGIIGNTPRMETAVEYLDYLFS